MLYFLGSGYNVLLHQDHWDSSKEAGPAQRPAAKFEEEPPTMQICNVTPTELKCLSVSFVICAPALQ